MVYVYAISDPDAAATAPGLEGAEVRTLREGALAALVSVHERLETTAEVNRLWEHEAVVESAGADGAAVLPLRLGSALAGEDAVRAMLRERAAEFTEALDRVRGAVELSVRAALAIPEEPAATAAPGISGSGTAYMLGRLAQTRHEAEIMRTVDPPLAELARDSARLGSALADRDAQVRLAYLVERAAVQAFRARVEALAETRAGLRLACTGPWPPYSFVGGAAE